MGRGSNSPSFFIIMRYNIGDNIYILGNSNGLANEMVNRVYTVRDISNDAYIVYADDDTLEDTPVLAEDGCNIWHVAECDAVHPDEVVNTKNAIKNNLEDIKRISEEIYPQRFEFDESDNRYRLTYHFPEVTTTNSKNVSQTHRDIFITITMNQFGKIESVQGRRTTFTYLEYICRYNHPHIAPGIKEADESGYRSTCFGGNTSITHVLDELKLNFNIDLFESFLYLLQDWITWESLEGGPFAGGTSSLRYRLDSVEKLKAETYHECFVEFVREADDLNIYFYGNTDSNRFKVSPDDQFINILNRVLPDKYKCIKIGNEYYRNTYDTKIPEKIIKLNKENKNRYITFKGKKFQVTILPETEEAMKTPDNLVPNPFITKYIVQQLEDSLNEKEYTKVLEQANLVQQ